MRRPLDLDVLVCPRCGGRLSVVATSQDPCRPWPGPGSECIIPAGIGVKRRCVRALSRAQLRGRWHSPAALPPAARVVSSPTGA